MFAIEAAIGLLALVISTLVIHFKVHQGFTKKLEQHAEDVARDREREDRRAKYAYPIPRVGILVRGKTLNGVTYGTTDNFVEFDPGDGEIRCSGWRPGAFVGNKETFIFLGSIHEESLSTGIRWVGCYLRSRDSKIVYAHDYVMEEVK